jgi:hypothetical protein
MAEFIHSELRDLDEAITLSKLAVKIYMNPDLFIEEKYRLIFSKDICVRISQLGYAPDWIDPDTSYGEDLYAYMSELERQIPELEDKFKRMWRAINE